MESCPKQLVFQDVTFAWNNILQHYNNQTHNYITKWKCYFCKEMDLSYSFFND